MPDLRGRKGRTEDLLPDDRVTWAREIWRDRDGVAKLPSGAWMLREAAKVLGLTEEAVDEVLRHWPRYRRCKRRYSRTVSSRKLAWRSWCVSDHSLSMAKVAICMVCFSLTTIVLAKI